MNEAHTHSSSTFPFTEWGRLMIKTVNISIKCHFWFKEEIIYKKKRKAKKKATLKWQKIEKCQSN